MTGASSLDSLLVYGWQLIQGVKLGLAQPTTTANTTKTMAPDRAIHPNVRPLF